MAANRNLILAGISGGGAAGTSLANFAPKGTVLPTAATGTGSTLDPAFRDAGWVDTQGLKRAVNESTQEIDAYGVVVPVRILITKSRVDFDLTFLESNTTTLAVYHRLPLTGTGSLTADAGGNVDFTEGGVRIQEYTAVFDIVDGTNLVRACVPGLQVTGRQQFQASAGNPLTYGVTLTAFPGSDGVAVHWYYHLPALAG